MIKKLLYIIFLLLSIGLAGCNDERPSLSATFGEITDRNPIHFVFNAPDAIFSRSVDNAKKEFTNGDRIFLQAVFYGDQENELSRVNAVYELKDNAWIPDVPIFWDQEAKTGSFKAFYIKNLPFWNFTGENNWISMSKLEDDADPLMAETDKLKYGHTVEMNFKHVLTHVSFINLEPALSTEYWFVPEKNNTPFYNQFRLTIDADTKDLKLDFQSMQDEDYDNLGYVASTPSRTSNKEKVGFFIYPGVYATMDVMKVDNHPFFNYTNSIENIEFLANYAYEIDLERSSGVVFLEDDITWDETSGAEVEFKDFMEAVTSSDKDFLVGEEGQQTEILRKVSNGWLLMRNVSFTFNKYEDYSGILSADIAQGTLFDGNMHSLDGGEHGIPCAIFGSNSGTIENLWVKNIKIENITSVYSSVDKEDNSRNGAFCKRNNSTGKIRNVRIENSSLSVKINETSSENNHNAGSIVGSNLGEIDDLYLGNMISIETANDGASDVNATLSVGGVVGQNMGSISNVLPFTDNLKVSVTNRCTGSNPVYYVGGGAGSSNGSIRNLVLPSVAVDNSESIGFGERIGGLVGNAYRESGIAIINSCTIGGDVKAGKMQESAINNGYSTVGGIAGYVRNIDVLDCKSTCDVSGVSEENKNVIYSTGGAFGELNTDNSISGNYAYGNSLVAASGSVGNFAGTYPSGKSWEDYAGDNFAKSLVINY